MFSAGSPHCVAWLYAFQCFPTGDLAIVIETPGTIAEDINFIGD